MTRIERETIENCAKIADKYARPYGPYGEIASDIATEIRALIVPYEEETPRQEGIPVRDAQMARNASYDPDLPGSTAQQAAARQLL